jgi:hypothetical protein
VTKRLVELMGGTIGVDSTSARAASSGWNSVLAPRRNFADRSPRANILPRYCAAGRTPMHALRTVLYVEDNPANLELVEQLIARRPTCGC